MVTGSVTPAPVGLPLAPDIRISGKRDSGGALPLLGHTGNRGRLWTGRELVRVLGHHPGRECLQVGTVLLRGRAVAGSIQVWVQEAPPHRGTAGSAPGEGTRVCSCHGTGGGTCWVRQAKVRAQVTLLGQEVRMLGPGLLLPLQESFSNDIAREGSGLPRKIGPA